MRRHLLAASAFLVAVTAVPSRAQTLGQAADDVKLQVHGFATQGFLYTTRNNWATTNSSDGSAAWTEAVVNLTAQPESKLRVGIQARYFLLGDYGNNIGLDWAQADYKFNEAVGFRVGKVKTPVGLFNEAQDIDPALLWVLLPQSIYPITSRNAILAHYGGVVYGKVPLAPSFGKLEYRAFGGQRVLSASDGFFQGFRDAGVNLPKGTSGHTFGGTLRWHAPLHGLSFGASENAGQTGGEFDAGPLVGKLQIVQFRQTWYFGQFERNRFTLSAEFQQFLLRSSITFPGLPVMTDPVNPQNFYVMASGRVTSKLTAGAYYSSSLDRQAAISSGRYQKDFDLTARYDFSPSFYAKAEQHFMDGTAIGYSTLDNLNLQPDTRMTLLKLGVSF